jgi:hypothetical protein
MNFLGATSPLLDVTGCYRGKVAAGGEDEICIDSSGRYTQHRLVAGVSRQYNEGAWTSFEYNDHGEEYVAVTLKSFRPSPDPGSTEKPFDLDIQPHKNSAGRALFFYSQMPSEWHPYFRR